MIKQQYWLTLGVVLTLSVPLAGCPFGYVREDDPVAVRQAQLDERVARIERVAQNQSLLQLAGRIDELQAEVRTLRGEVERLSHDMTGTQERQRDLYLDIDRRLQVLEAGNTQSAAGDDRGTYQTAFDLLKQGRYEQAEQAFGEFLQKHPNSRLRDNAQYWLGEANYVTRDFKQAIAEFRKLLEQYPDSAKVPDAWLKLGYCHYELGEWAKAREALNKVVSGFPDHAAANLAKQRLERMKSEGR